MSRVHISSPFIRSFSQSDTTVGTSFVEVLTAMPPEGKCITTIIQNKSSTATIEVIFGDTGTVNNPTNGVILQPLTIFSLDNYNGPVRVQASATGTVVHAARGTV